MKLSLKIKFLLLVVVLLFLLVLYASTYRPTQSSQLIISTCMHTYANFFLLSTIAYIYSQFEK